MTTGLQAPVLILNRHFQPVRITHARRALMLLFGGAARALDGEFEAYDFERWMALPPLPGYERIGTSSGSLHVPRVLQLLGYGRIPNASLRLSRRNVYLRDDYTCQYCARRMATKDLNLDHVTPRSKGGTASWVNLVTACRRCNFRKGNATPEAAGMRLLKPPRRPSWSTAAALATAPERFAEWEPFL
jgi:5-methylcytosine-specific restriction endonuclease McrA